MTLPDASNFQYYFYNIQVALQEPVKDIQGEY